MKKPVYKIRIEEDPVGLIPVLSDESLPDKCGNCVLGPFAGAKPLCAKAPCCSDLRPDGLGVYYIAPRPPNKADIKRLNALVEQWEKQEETLQRQHGDAWPRSIRASQKLDCAALARVLKLLEQFQGA